MPPAFTFEAFSKTATSQRDAKVRSHSGKAESRQRLRNPFLSTCQAETNKLGTSRAASNRTPRDVSQPASPSGLKQELSSATRQGGLEEDDVPAEQVERLGRAVSTEKGSTVVESPLTDDELMAYASADSEAADTDAEDAGEEGEDSQTGGVGSQEGKSRLFHVGARPSRRDRVILPNLTLEEEMKCEEPGYLFNLLSDELGVLMPTWKANRWHNSNVTNLMLTKAHTWKGILWVFRDLRHCTDPVTTSTALHRLAKHAARHKVPIEELRREPDYALLIKVVRKHFPKMQPRAKASVVWALATLREHRMNGIFDFLLTYMEENGFDGPWRSQELSNVSWAMATMRKRRLGLLNMLADEVIKQDTSAFKSQGIANISWAFASLSYGLYHKEDDLAYRREQLFTHLAEGCWMRLESFETQAISNIAWSFGNVGMYHMRLSEAINREAISRIHLYSNQEISNTIIGLVKVNQARPALFEAIEREFLLTHEKRFHVMKSQVLANVLWALATVRYYSEPLLRLFTEELLERLDGLEYREVAIVMWSVAKLGYHPGEGVVRGIDKFIVKKLPGFSAQATSNLLWSIAVLQATHLACFQKLIDHLGTIAIKEVDVVQLHQLFQALLLATIERQYNPDSTQLNVPPEVVNLITRVWKRLVHQTNVSSFQVDVSDRLKEMAIEHVQEYMAEEGLFSIDIAFSGPNNMRVAMEVDGPYHFTSNTNQPVGSSLLRHRLLRALGWTIVSIPYYEYYKLGTYLEKYEYIAKKLLTVGIKVDQRRIQEAYETTKDHVQPGAMLQFADAASLSQGLQGDADGAGFLAGEPAALGAAPPGRSEQGADKEGSDGSPQTRAPLKNPLAKDGQTMGLPDARGAKAAEPRKEWGTYSRQRPRLHWSNLERRRKELFDKIDRDAGYRHR